MKVTDLALLTGSEMKPFLVQPIQGVPVEAFPGAAAIMQAQVEEGEDGFVDPVGVDLHAGMTSAATTRWLAGPTSSELGELVVEGIALDRLRIEGGAVPFG